MARRLKAMGSARYQSGFTPTLHVDLIDLPKKWKKPRTIFVNSMSDLFQESVPESFIAGVFETMVQCRQHVFQILTKRGDRLLELSPRLPWAENIWMGVSVENSTTLSRIDDLRETSAHLKFISCEPLLGPLNDMDLTGIDWVIVGGESGPGARPMRESWVKSIQRQCDQSGTAFFFKQWGGVRKDLNGRKLDGRTFDAMPTGYRSQPGA
jgi:protein gp37